MKMNTKREKINRGREVHGLDKLPDHIIIKELRKEIGTLKAYIDELEYNQNQNEKNLSSQQKINSELESKLNVIIKKELNEEELKEVVIDIKETFFIKNIIKENTSLIEKNKALTKENDKLLNSLIQMQLKK